MRRVRSSAVLLLLVAASARAQTAPHANTSAAISAADVKARIGYLASDAMKGRDTPSPGLEAAAAYIANEFKSLGLQPAGDSGTFIQRWPYERRVLSTSRLNAVLGSSQGNRRLTYLEEFFVIPGQQDSVSGAIFYAGAASAQPSALPSAANGQILAYFIPGKAIDNDWARIISATISSAIPTRPRGIVLFLDPELPKDQISYLATQAGGSDAPIPIVGVRYDVAKEWLTQAGMNLDAMRMRSTPDTALSPVEFTVTTRLEAAAARPPNVVAILPGSDPVLRDSYVVFSAHMDHVGVGSANAKGDSIFNGADDDASGTSAVLELAQAFAALPAAQRPKRSLIFLTVSGEEKGLFGSKHFVEHPPVAAEKIVANINIDMIGRNNPDTVVAIGQEYTTLGTIVQQVRTAHPELKLVVAPDLWPQEQLFFRSDHFNFAAKNIPAIFFTTGLHADYHQQSDEPATIDNEKLARIAQLIFHFGESIAANATAPAWTEQGKAAMKAISGNE